MKKRVLSLALALVMVCGLLTVTASAATVTQVVPYKYNAVYDFSEGLAVVRNDNGWGVIDTTGKEVIPCGGLDYEYLDECFHNGRLAVADASNQGGQSWFTFSVGYVDVTGQEVIPCGTYRNSYDCFWGTDIGFNAIVEPVRFHDGVASLRTRVIDTDGNEIVPDGKYDRINGFSEGFAAVELNGKWGFIDKTGKEVIPCQYRSAEAFENGRAVVEGSTGQIANGHTVYAEGVIDTQGNLVVPFGQYKAPDDEYHDVLNAVQSKDGKWGFVDRAGNQVIPAKYDDFGSKRYDSSGAVHWYTPSFTNGLAAVYLSGKGHGYIDLQGNEVLPFQYGSDRQLSDGMLAVDLDGKWGFVRVEGLPTEPKPAPAPTPTPTPQQPTVPTAYASTQVVQVDGKPVTFNAYALKDANGNDTNYIKLRDVADVLNGSAAQFQVGWDGTIAITTGQTYTPNGSENIQNFKGNQSYTVSTSPVTVNGKTANLEAITLTDASGGGYTYFKLRDLGQALGFNVSWSAQTGITIDPNTPYNPNN